MPALRLLFLGAFVALPAAAVAQLPSDPVAASLARTVDSAAQARGFSGVVLIAKDGAPVWEAAYGFADREHGVKNTVTTRFNVSSVGKLFTQAAVTQLQSAGKISAGATIATYWPDYPNHAFASTATIAMLLTHRSGLQSDIFAPARLDSLDRNHDYLATFVRDSTAFAPGTQQQYSNAGFVLLGELVERVSGERYEDYLRTHVFAPAGMTHTDFDRRDSPTSDRATGYTRWLVPNGDSTGIIEQPSMRLMPRRGSAAGGEFSTVEDLERFVVARRSGKIPGVAPRGPARMLGGSSGFNSAVFEGIRPGYDIVVLSNEDPPAASDLVELVRAPR